MRIRRPNDRVRRWLPVALVAIAVFVALAVALWRRPESIAVHARKLYECFEQNDAACLASYADDDERAFYALTSERLSGLLRDYIEPGLEAAKVEEAPRLDVSAGAGQAIVMGSYRSKAGDLFAFGLTVRQTDRGVRAHHLVSSLVLAAMQAKYRTGEGTGGQRLLGALRTGVREDRARLEALGIRGLYSNQRGRHLDWDAYSTEVRRLSR